MKKLDVLGLALCVVLLIIAVVGMNLDGDAKYYVLPVIAVGLAGLSAIDGVSYKQSKKTSSLIRAFMVGVMAVILTAAFVLIIISKR